MRKVSWMLMLPYALKNDETHHLSTLMSFRGYLITVMLVKIQLISLWSFYLAHSLQGLCHAILTSDCVYVCKISGSLVLELVGLKFCKCDCKLHMSTKARKQWWLCWCCWCWLMCMLHVFMHAFVLHIYHGSHRSLKVQIFFQFFKSLKKKQGTWIISQKSSRYWMCPSLTKFLRRTMRSGQVSKVKK